jgi:hypothetical protein
VSIATGIGSNLSVTADGAGAWSATVPAANLPESGTVTFTVTSSNAVGNIATVTRNVEVDTTAPGAPTLTSPTHTRAVRPLLAGTAEPGSSIVLTAGGASFSAITGDDGIWRVNTATAQSTGTFNLGADGPKAVQISSTDAAGNSSSNSDTSITLDTRAPEAQLRLATHVTLEEPSLDVYRTPRVLSLPEGEFLVCWAGEEGEVIFTQLFSENGTTSQEPVAITALPGDTVENLHLVHLGIGKGAAVSWLSVSSPEWQPYVQVINDLGEPTSAPVPLTIPGASYGDTPALAAVGADGEFVAVWSAYFPEVGFGTHEIILQRFSLNDSGEPSPGDPIVLPKHPLATGNPADPQIAALGSDGDFVVVWRAGDQNNDFSLIAQRFDQDGVASEEGPLFIEPDPVTDHDEDTPRIAVLGTDGAFVLVYESYPMYGEGPSQSFMSYVNSAGAVSDALPLLAPGMEGVNAQSPVVSALSDNSFVVAWVLGEGEEEAQQVCVQRFVVGQTGITAGTVHKLPALSAYSEAWDLQVLPWGEGFAMSWEAWDGETDRVLVQLFDRIHHHHHFHQKALQFLLDSHNFLQCHRQ